MIEELERANVDERKCIEENAWIKIDELKDRNKEELTLIIKEGMKNKSDLQKETGTFRTKNTERETLVKEIKEKSINIVKNPKMSGSSASSLGASR